MKNMHFDEVSGDASSPTDYTNHLKNDKKVSGLNPGILVTLE